MKVTFSVSFTEFDAGQPGEPASACAVPVPTLPFRHLDGIVGWPSMSETEQPGLYPTGTGFLADGVPVDFLSVTLYDTVLVTAQALAAAPSAPTATTSSAGSARHPKRNGPGW